MTVNLAGSRFTWKTNLWTRMGRSSCIKLRWEDSSSQTWVVPFHGPETRTEWGWRRKLSTCIHLSLLPDGTCSVTSCLSSWCHDLSVMLDCNLQTMNPKHPYLSSFSQLSLSQPWGKATKIMLFYSYPFFFLKNSSAHLKHVLMIIFFLYTLKIGILKSHELKYLKLFKEFETYNKSLSRCFLCSLHSCQQWCQSWHFRRISALELLFLKKIKR